MSGQLAQPLILDWDATFTRYIKQLKREWWIICPLLESQKKLECGSANTANYFREWDSKGTV